MVTLALFFFSYPSFLAAHLMEVNPVDGGLKMDSCGGNRAGKGEHFFGWPAHCREIGQKGFRIPNPVRGHRLWRILLV